MKTKHCFIKFPKRLIAMLALFGEWNSDGKISSFLNANMSRNHLLFKGVTNDNEAKSRATAYALGIKAYYDLNLEKKGISKADWGKALIDEIRGKENALYRSVINGE